MKAEVIYMLNIGEPFVCGGMPEVKCRSLFGRADLPFGEYANICVRLYKKGDRVENGRRAKRETAMVECQVGDGKGHMVLRNKNTVPGRWAEVEPTQEALLSYLNKQLGTGFREIVVETKLEMLDRLHSEAVSLMRGA